MTLLLMESFDTGITNTELLTKYSANGSGSIASTAPAVHTNWKSVDQATALTYAIPVAAQDDVLIIGANCYRGAAATADDGNGNGGIFRLTGDAGATVHVTVAEVSDGSLRVRRGSASGTTLGTTAPALVSVGTWYHLVMKVTLHDSAGTVDLWLNGTNVLSLTSQDTKNGGTATVFDRAEWHGTNSGFDARRFDDTYLCNGLGSSNNDNLGVCRVNPVLPTSDGAVEDWSRSSGSDSYALIDEATPNSDTDYIQSDVAAAKTRVGMADLSDTDHAIYGVQVTTHARKDDAGLALFRSGLRSGSSDANGADKTLTESYIPYWDIIEQNPDGAVVWTPTTFNAAEAFVEVR